MNNLLDLPLRYSIPPFKRMMKCIVQCLRSLRACPVLYELSMFKKCQVGICTRCSRSDIEFQSGLLPLRLLRSDIIL